MPDRLDALIAWIKEREQQSGWPHQDPQRMFNQLLHKIARLDAEHQPSLLEAHGWVRDLCHTGESGRREAVLDSRAKIPPLLPMDSPCFKISGECTAEEADILSQWLMSHCDLFYLHDLPSFVGHEDVRDLPYPMVSHEWSFGDAIIDPEKRFYCLVVAPI